MKAPDRLPLIRINEPENLKKLVKDNRNITKKKTIKSAPVKKIKNDPVEIVENKSPIIITKAQDNCRCKKVDRDIKGAVENIIESKKSEKMEAIEEKVIEKVKAMKIA